MDPQLRRYNKRSILYAIGAGTLLLALMAFSAICLGVIHVCGRWFTWGIFSFWEILGISLISFVGFIGVRSWQRRKKESQGVSVSLTRRLRRTVEEKPKNWRDLYEQMSEEERTELKAMMRKYCSEQGARPAGAGAAADRASSDPSRSTSL
jgi:hypothetical protein